MRDLSPLSAESIKFRQLVIDRLWHSEATYINQDVFVGECPICEGPIGVRFAGGAPRVTLECHTGCSESELGRVLGLEVAP